MRENIKLSSPWVTYYKEIVAMFGEDPDIKIDFDEAENTVKLFVNGQDKADALTQLLPMEKEFGNVVLYIEVIPANKQPSKIDVYRKAFDGNPAFSYSATIEGIMSNPISYLVFRNKVVQFYNDDLGDINGNKNTLYQDIAEDLFENHDGICFCTDTPENLGKPLGEWT